MSSPKESKSNGNRAFNLDALLGVMPKEVFELPITQEANDYFPDFLKGKISAFKMHFRKVIKPHITESDLFPDILLKQIQKELNSLSSGIVKAVNYYYEGNIHEASKSFYDTLDDINFSNRSGALTLNKETNFYRTRFSSSTGLSKKDLFHNPFQNRHLVKTSRYSIPGFPALYVGDSVYVCWEEYNRPKIRKVFFSRLTSTRKLNLIRVQRLDDFIKMMTKFIKKDSSRQVEALKYVVLFPLLIACAIRTKEPDGIFKPEYIIPQLLLQYVSNSENIDGIMFLSTKVDYKKITDLPAYNYVFPVKKIAKEGYCTVLLDAFLMTEPSSVEIEDLINHRRVDTPATDPSKEAKGSIRIVEGIDSPYRLTALGHLEEILISRDVTKIPTA